MAMSAKGSLPNEEQLLQSPLAAARPILAMKRPFGFAMNVNGKNSFLNAVAISESQSYYSATDS